MPKIKPRSKRQTLSKRHSIEKKIGRHNQKMRRLAKRYPEARKKMKKDLGVPHLCPLKEELIKKYEEARLQKQQEKLMAKEAKKTEKKAN